MVQRRGQESTVLKIKRRWDVEEAKALGFGKGKSRKCGEEGTRLLGRWGRKHAW